jgi:superkiller protein 3
MVLAAALLVAAGAAAHADIVTTTDPGQVHFLSDPVGAMKAAREKVAAGDVTGAIRDLGRYVAAHPGEAGPARLLGDLYYRVGDFSRAQAAYEAILAYNPADKETHNRLGTVYATLDRVDEAIEQFNASLPGTDSVPDLVTLHQRRGDFKQYQGSMERLASSFPYDADLQAELGRVYSASGRPNDAIVYYRRALDDDAQSLDALNWYGLALMDLHDNTTAIVQFAKCTALDPSDYACVANTGAAYLSLGLLNVAEPFLVRARDIAPEQPEALVNLGYLADARRDWKGAVAWYLRALAASPYSRDAYIDLGYEYENHQLYPQAEAVLVKGITVDPTEGRLHVLLGLTYQAIGHPDLALSQFKLAETSGDPAIANIARQSFIALTDTAPPTAAPTPHY